MHAVSSRLPAVQGTETRSHGPRPRPAAARRVDPPATVSLSSDALAHLAEERARQTELNALHGRLPGAKARADQAQRDAEEALSVQSGETLSEDEERYVQDLRARDAEVRSHEAAHVAAAAGHAGTPQYTTVVGPDGRHYAVGGSVSIDLSTAGSPQATADKMRTIKAAASAVSSMSGADMRVAAKADRAMHAAQQQADRARATAAYESAAALGAGDDEQKV